MVMPENKTGTADHASVETQATMRYGQNLKTLHFIKKFCIKPMEINFCQKGCFDL